MRSLGGRAEIRSRAIRSGRIQALDVPGQPAKRPAPRNPKRMVQSAGRRPSGTLQSWANSAAPPKVRTSARPNARSGTSSLQAILHPRYTLARASADASRSVQAVRSTSRKPDPTLIGGASGASPVERHRLRSALRAASHVRAICARILGHIMGRIGRRPQPIRRPEIVGRPSAHLVRDPQSRKWSSEPPELHALRHLAAV